MILINPGREGLNSRGSGGNRRFQLRTWQTAQEAKRGKRGESCNLLRRFEDTPVNEAPRALVPPARRTPSRRASSSSRVRVSRCSYTACSTRTCASQACSPPHRQSRARAASPPPGCPGRAGARSHSLLLRLHSPLLPLLLLLLCCCRSSHRRGRAHRGRLPRHRSTRPRARARGRAPLAWR